MPYILWLGPYDWQETINIRPFQDMNAYIGNDFQEVIPVYSFSVTNMLQMILQTTEDQGIHNYMLILSPYHQH